MRWNPYVHVCVGDGQVQLQQLLIDKSNDGGCLLCCWFINGSCVVYTKASLSVQEVCYGLQNLQSAGQIKGLSTQNYKKYKHW